ncbi:PREDICTED: endosialin [Nanorana parkeri]|uniref:endosialin n=1 Tax=Nanorana parkeri TaxID=125878 RepID=UPI000854D1CA|nr:PREDICTED: endosialin [Nanorana parkeri]
MISFILSLQVAIFLPISLSYELKEHDALCGPSDSCYAVFYQRRTFLESWRACRERGGNLATVKNAQEASLVEQLLTSSTGSRSDGDLQLRLWIGLQRQPRQCAPQKPLRGFTWTTGDQDTAYTNWVTQAVSASSTSSCSAPRCVAIGLGYGKPEDDFKWLEGSCTLPVDGFVCKFRYQGLCSTLTEVSVRYSVPFGYEGTWLDLLPFGTVATVSCEGQHQSTSVLCMLKEDGTVGWNKNEPFCQSPEDLQCQECQQLCDRGVCSCQDGYVLQPDGHSCEPEDDHNYEAQGCPCQYQCIAGTNGQGYQCICPEGYELAADEHSCEDVDECEDEETCEHSCQNTLGSYTCSCDLGFTVAEDDPERCVDIDECRIARMCQQMCVNYIGGFECYCSEGYELDVDRVSCKPLDLIEPRHEPNPSVTRIFDQELETFDTATEGWYWEDLYDTETPARSYTDQPTTPFKKETTTVGPTMNKISETTTYLLDLENHMEITASPTVTQAQTMPPSYKMDKIRRTTFQTNPPRFFLSSTIPAKYLSTTLPKDESSVDEWQREKFTSAIYTTVPSKTITALEQARISTTEPYIFPEDDNPTTTEVPTTGVRININTVSSLDLSLSNHIGNAVSPDISSISSNTSQESKGKRDNRWLVVALLVPLCVFLVIMLALGIVYCTRCGGETKPRSVTDCYHWVTGGGPEKGLPPSGVDISNNRGGV